jgi:hypothetical protein
MDFDKLDFEATEKQVRVIVIVFPVGPSTA